MRFALVNNVRCEASPGLVALCPGCSAQVIAKCGTRRIWHWSHRGQRNCDPWWETETEWHRAWKNLFPVDMQEIAHLDVTGERHIADIKTAQGLVIEVQHSAIADTEMNAREDFYKNMVWIVDATRLKRDLPRFNKNANHHFRDVGNGYFISLFPEECFPQNWVNRTVPVLFDFEALSGFRDGKSLEGSLLWVLLPGRVRRNAIVARVSRKQFAEIAMQRAQIFRVADLQRQVSEWLDAYARAMARTIPPPPRPYGFRTTRRRYPRF